MNALYSLLYVSIASRDFQQNPDIDRILRTSLSWNKSVNITGALIFSGLQFSQYIEGKKEDIEKLFERIWTDNRHHSIRVVNRTDIKQRVFPHWSLAYSGRSEYVRQQLKALYNVSSPESCAVSGGISTIQLMEDLVSIQLKLGPTIH